MKLSKNASFLCEAEITEGLESITEVELKGYKAKILAQRPGEIDFWFAGELSTLLNLKTVQSISLMLNFPIPRPRALLSNEYLPLIFQVIQTVLSLSSPGKFRTFFLAAAGADSTIMQRIRNAIAAHSGLVDGGDKGDLGIRIRAGKKGGWDVLVRLSQRPLVTRTWRVCNLEGGLNAATAAAMVILTMPTPDDIFVNLGCGSATLLIERLNCGNCQCAIGFDNNLTHLHCAQANIDASGQKNKIQVQLGDMRHIPLASASVNVLCADLPFGQLSGAHRTNMHLYPLMLHEAGRVAVSGARFALITHDIRLMEQILAHDLAWSVDQTIKVNLRGLHPRVYLLKRR